MSFRVMCWFIVCVVWWVDGWFCVGECLCWVSMFVNGWSVSNLFVIWWVGGFIFGNLGILIGCLMS